LLTCRTSRLLLLKQHEPRHSPRYSLSATRLRHVTRVSPAVTGTPLACTAQCTPVTASYDRGQIISRLRHVTRVSPAVTGTPSACTAQRDSFHSILRYMPYHNEVEDGTRASPAVTGTPLACTAQQELCTPCDDAHPFFAGLCAV
jgi:hypothetical protein